MASLLVDVLLASECEPPATEVARAVAPPATRRAAATASMPTARLRRVRRTIWGASKSGASAEFA
ncbi:hypothetical protein [Streptomyces canus]|uniref:hypothetical protein n=1 Tax=Streptomyces canus TaxID=58343 RepID=UPI00382C15C6